MDPVATLRSLRDRPFELLRTLDLRARAAAQGQTESGASGPEWVGIAFRMGGEAFLLAREETREVLSYPVSVTRIPGAKNWVRGLANVRGQLLPIIDLRSFLGSGNTSVTRTTVLNLADRLAKRGWLWRSQHNGSFHYVAAIDRPEAARTVGP